MSRPGRTALCTIVARNYIALARSLLASVAEFEPEIERFVFILDDVAGVEAVDEGTVLRPDDVFDDAAFAELVRGYGIIELATAVKPALLRYLLDRDFARVLYFDPDIQVFAALDPVIAPLETNDIALTPHTTDATPLGRALRAELLILRTGIFNLGFIGVANTADARAMLAWWAERLEQFCRVDAISGLFVDQRWMDLVPGLFERTAIVRHRGCNVAYWNVRTRRLAASDELRLETGEPLVFFHFSSFDLRKPGRLSKYPSHVALSDAPRLQRLLASYAQRLTERGHLERMRIPFGLGGVPLRARLRALQRQVFSLVAHVRHGASRRSSRRRTSGE